MSSQRSSVACVAVPPRVGPLWPVWSVAVPHPVSRWFCVSGDGGLLQHRAPGSCVSVWTPRLCPRGCGPMWSLCVGVDTAPVTPGVWAHVVPGVSGTGGSGCPPSCVPRGTPRPPDTRGPEKLAAFLARPRTSVHCPTCLGPGVIRRASCSDSCSAGDAAPAINWPQLGVPLCPQAHTGVAPAVASDRYPDCG